MYVVRSSGKVWSAALNTIQCSGQCTRCRLCAWSQAPFLAHKPPSRALPLTETLGEIIRSVLEMGIGKIYLLEVLALSYINRDDNY